MRGLNDAALLGLLENARTRPQRHGAEILAGMVGRTGSMKRKMQTQTRNVEERVMPLADEILLRRRAFVCG